MSQPYAYLILDGAWGSCGKGSLAGKLALDRRPDVIVCNFGPNAGHTFIGNDGKSIMTQQVPTGAVHRDARILIGPGAMVDPTILAKELEMLKDYGVSERLFIHPRAAVVLPIDKEREGGLVKIGSTRKGTASAACRKIMRVDEGYPRIAAECIGRDGDLGVIGDHTIFTVEQYDSIIANARTIQIESAQGVELSLARGMSYPTCTGRDVTPEQILNDVAVPHRFLRETNLVIRTFPIRVGNEYDKDGNEIGHSGPVFPDQLEMTWEQISELAGVPLLERTTVTKKVRRIFSFSKDQLAHALYLAGPCNIFLNYMNYFDPNTANIAHANEKATEFYEDLWAFVRLHGSNITWLGWGPAYKDVQQVGNTDTYNTHMVRGLE